jgi:hypothetical protein
MADTPAKKTSCARSCRRVWSIIVLILLWASIIFTIIVGTSSNQDALGVAIGFLVFFYLAYTITACCSPTCSYLFNKHKADSIHDYMRSLFSSPPKVTWHIECYHYETRTHHHKKSDGTTETRHETHKVVTYRESEDFNYYSWRDISGLFLLDSHKIFRSHNKVYIKLELEQDINFADDITKLDYQKQKDNFYYRNRWRDVHVDLREVRHVPGFNQFNMVRISNVHPPCVNKWMYLFFVFVIPLVDLYKMYVDQFCVEQDYSIKKVISSRFNLNQPQYAEPYQNFVPALVIFDQPRQVYCEQTELIHDTPNIPSFDELEEAKKFTNAYDFPNQREVQNYQPHFQQDQYNNNFSQGVDPNNQNLQYNSITVNVNVNPQNVQLGNQDVNMNTNFREKLI